MSTITQEWLRSQISAIKAVGITDSNTLQAFEIALASLEAEPVGYFGRFDADDEDLIDQCSPNIIGAFPLYAAPPAPANAEPVAWLWSHRKHPNEVTLVRPEDDERAEGAHWSGWSCQALYAEPPAPVSVPDDVTAEDCPAFVRYDITEVDEAWARGFNACRAAMLQGAEPVTTAYKLPMQPLVIDAHGTLRFKENPIVRKLLDYATEHGYGLNEIALDEFEAEDQMQLAQLIGYSLSGYGTLSYVTDESYDRAAAAAPQQEVKS
ncbi:TPA: hypothetical protein N5L20_002681 [Enterobacter kobei]|uniref:hypothetical protein n=1 Tax=Enterobacter kobei TaxID=208224 RepID=UPI0029D90590|nr:hypothetical protein [Enterobacter kobei]MDX7049125.1 hypothetical protein [Enterobacter kobei]HCM9273871.1 hypothetical protein [Enterobacter kobei]